MGFLLKIAIFAVAAYTVWTSVGRLLGKPGSRPTAPPPVPLQPSASPRTVEDTRQCPVCGDFVAVGAAKCGRADCPQPA